MKNRPMHRALSAFQRHLGVTAASLLLFSCATSGPSSSAPSVPINPAHTEYPEEQVQATISMQDGTAIERAIVVDASNEKEGGAFEMRWVAEHFPGYRMQKQSVSKHEGRMYDTLHIVDASGEEHVIHFDITSFFGKK